MLQTWQLGLAALTLLVWQLLLHQHLLVSRRNTSTTSCHILPTTDIQTQDLASGQLKW
jgi:predicted DNA-binding protein with PD1-like motif